MRILALVLALAGPTLGIALQGSVSRGPIETARRRELEKTAQHNLEVARFYIRKQKWSAARSRLQDIVKEFSEFGQMSEVFLLLGEVYRATNDRELAIELYSRVVEEFPDSEFAARARERLQELNEPAKRRPGETAKP